MLKTVLTFLTLSILANVYLLSHHVFLTNNNPAKLQQEQIESLPYLSPRIFLTQQNDILINFVPLRTKLHQYIESLPNKTGVYFEYLPSGNSIGVNDRTPFISASLLKVPLIMGIYHKMADGSIPADKILTIKESHLDTRFGILWKQGVGKQLPIEEVIRMTLQHSDNTGANMLLELINGDEMTRVFNALDIPIEVEGSESVITPKNYSSILRSLYLSSYLPKESSNKILEYLTATDFDNRIHGKIPQDVKVAHKIGVALRNTNANLNTYTDCGIVYVPKRPFILCVMTHNNEESANETISEIAQLAYDYVSSVN